MGGGGGGGDRAAAAGGAVVAPELGAVLAPQAKLLHGVGQLVLPQQAGRPAPVQAPELRALGGSCGVRGVRGDGVEGLLEALALAVVPALVVAVGLGR